MRTDNTWVVPDAVREAEKQIATLTAQLKDSRTGHTHALDVLMQVQKVLGAEGAGPYGAAKTAEHRIAVLTEAHAKACFERDAARADRDEARARWAELDARMAVQRLELQSPPAGFTVEEQSVSFMARDGNLDERVLWDLREEGHTHGYFNTRGQAIEAACAIVEGRKP